MKLSSKLCLIALVMLFIAVVFFYCALANPALGRTLYIGSFAVDASVWRLFYKIYLAIMLILFLSSFVMRKNHR